MIVVVGRVVTDAGKRDELIRIGQTIARSSRDEDGCLSYRVYEDTEREHEFVFVEEWASEEALRRHFATEHVAEFMGAVLGALTAPPDVKFHTIASSLDLADVQPPA